MHRISEPESEMHISELGASQPIFQLIGSLPLRHPEFADRTTTHRRSDGCISFRGLEDSLLAVIRQMEPIMRRLTLPVASGS